jgi:hypothetical protein
MPSGNCNIVIVVNELTPWEGPSSEASFEVIGDFYVRRSDNNPNNPDIHRLTSWSAVVPFDSSEKNMRKSIIEAAVSRAAAMGFIVQEHSPIVLIGKPEVF